MTTGQRTRYASPLSCPLSTLFVQVGRPSGGKCKKNDLTVSPKTPLKSPAGGITNGVAQRWLATPFVADINANSSLLRVRLTALQDY